jgi:hypothetical protein
MIMHACNASSVWGRDGRIAQFEDIMGKIQQDPISDKNKTIEV